jgi:hypothetical protein
VIEMLHSRDAAVLVAVEPMDDAVGFGGVELLNLGPASCLVYEIHYSLRYGDPAYSADRIEEVVPGRPHLVAPGETYRILDHAVLETVRERSDDAWFTDGLGELTLTVKYVSTKESSMTVSLIVEARPDALMLDVRPVDRSAAARV